MTKCQHIMSKAMSYLLRHGLVKEGLTVSRDGYVLVDEVLKWLNAHGHGLTVTDIRDIVRADKKTRFALDESTGCLRIRANQGHSVELEQPVLSPYLTEGQVLHCTLLVHENDIRRTGLSPMGRTHVHMIMIDGSSWHMCRPSSDLYIFVDTTRARAAGLEFFLSDNGVVLCPTVIPPEFLTFVPAYPRGKSPCYGFIIRVHSPDAASVCYVKTPAGHWGFPKGKIEKGELPIACALRELYEETGIRYSDIRILPGASTELTDKGNNCTTYYYASVQSELPLVAQDPQELAEVAWHKSPPAGLLERRAVLLSVSDTRSHSHSHSHSHSKVA